MWGEGRGMWVWEDEYGWCVEAGVSRIPPPAPSLSFGASFTISNQLEALSFPVLPYRARALGESAVAGGKRAPADCTSPGGLDAIAGRVEFQRADRPNSGLAKFVGPPL